MAVEERVIYSAEQMTMAVERTLDNMKIFRYDGEYRSQLGEAFVDKLAFWEDNIRRQKNSPFTIAVIGDFKRGKSTFINALLGEEVAITNVTPETLTTNRITYGAHSNEAILSGNKKILLSDEEMTRERLKELMEEYQGEIKKIEIHRPIEMLKDICVVDTPGTGAAMEDFSDVVKDAILEADAVIYIYNVLYPLSQSEQMFLKTAVLPQKYTTLFLVGNFTDMIATEQDYEKLNGVLKARIEGLLPGSKVVTVSALDEFCRMTGQERTDSAMQGICEKQFGELRVEVSRLIEDKKDTVIVDRLQRLTRAMIESLNIELDAIISGLDMSKADAEAALRQLKQEKELSAEKQDHILNELESMTERMSAETNVWMREFLDRLNRESLSLGSVDTEDLLKYYNFYCVDLIQEALNSCLEIHREEMYHYIQNISDDLLEGLVKGFADTRKYRFSMNLESRMWTKGDTAGFVISNLGSFGVLGSVIQMAGYAVAGYAKEKERSDRKQEFENRIASQLTGLGVSVGNAVDNMYQELENYAKKLVLEYYADDLAQAEHLVSQSVAVAGNDEEKKDKIRVTVSTARKLLDECLAQMNG